MRHKQDWAAILLADARWAANRAGVISPRQKLPGWIQESTVVAGSFGDAYSKLARFCRNMQSA